MDTGIDYRSVNKRQFRTKSFKRLRLEAMITEDMALFDSGAIAIAAVTLDMMKALNIHEEDIEDIAAFAGQIEGVETAVTIRELRSGECKLSVRTSAGLNASAGVRPAGGRRPRRRRRMLGDGHGSRRQGRHSGRYPPGSAGLRSLECQTESL